MKTIEEIKRLIREYNEHVDQHYTTFRAGEDALFERFKELDKMMKDYPGWHLGTPPGRPNHATLLYSLHDEDTFGRKADE